MKLHAKCKGNVSIQEVYKSINSFVQELPKQTSKHSSDLFKDIKNLCTDLTKKIKNNSDSCAELEKLIEATLPKIIKNKIAEIKEQSQDKQAELKGEVKGIEQIKDDNLSDLENLCKDFSIEEKKSKDIIEEYVNIKEKHKELIASLEFNKNRFTSLQEQIKASHINIDKKTVEERLKVVVDKLFGEGYPSKALQVGSDYLYKFDFSYSQLLTFHLPTKKQSSYDLPVPKDSASLINAEQIIITGGYNKGFLNSCNAYSLATGKVVNFKPTEGIGSEENKRVIKCSMIIPRAEHTMVMADEWIYSIAGRNNEGYLRSCEKMLIGFSEECMDYFKWSEAPKLNEKKAKIGGCYFSKGYTSSIYIFGGITTDNKGKKLYLGTIEKLEVGNVVSPMWEKMKVIAGLEGYFFGIAVSEYNNESGIYVLGGIDKNENKIDKVHFIDFETYKVKEIKSLRLESMDSFTPYQPLMYIGETLWMAGHKNFYGAKNGKWEYIIEANLT